MRYRTRDGLEIEGDTPGAVIDALRSASRTPGRTRGDFIGMLARDAHQKTGVKIRTDDYTTVLDDLASAGLLKRLD